MQHSLVDIKRKQICPVLFRNSWDFKNLNPDSDFFRFIISEIMRWQYRKGRGISYEVLSSLISRLAIEKQVDRMEASKIQLAFKPFVSSGLYSKLDQVVINAEIQVGIQDGHVISHLIPALCQIEKNTVIVTWDENIKTEEDMRQSYETRLISLWCFYNLNRYPVFYNLFFDKENDKVSHIKYKPNQFYIRDSKAFISRLGGLFENNQVYPAPYEVCNACDRRPECQTTKIRIKNSQKSW